MTGIANGVLGHELRERGISWGGSKLNVDGSKPFARFLAGIAFRVLPSEKIPTGILLRLAAFLVAVAGPASAKIALGQAAAHPVIALETSPGPRPCILPAQAPYRGRSLWNTNLWPGGIVPYEFDTGAATTLADQRLMRQAMDELEATAAVHFVRRTGQSNYLHIQNDAGNSSYVGMIGGSQVVDIHDWTFRFAMCHELMHALGVDHEQSRPGRDQYVTINYGNIAVDQAQCGGSCASNFDISNGATPGPGPYDFDSVMHYGQDDFSSNGQPTIVVLPPNQSWQTLIGQRTHLSTGDQQGLVSRYGAPGTEWTQWEGNGPSARRGSAMVFDPVRSVAVLFGGQSASGYQSDTWTWNGSSWAQRGVTGPSARTSAAMSFDTGRGRGVLFGGDIGTSIVGETWEWTGTSWTQQFVSGPSPRTGAAMSFDSQRGVTVLFGGHDAGGAFSSETWEWNGGAWTRRALSGPSGRDFHATCYDSARGVTVLFGGHHANNNYDAETWEWNGTAWNRRSVSGPSARYLHTLSYDAARHVSVLYGGSNGTTTSSETWEWNGAAWIQRELSGPTPRAGHATVYDSARGATVLFGGAGESAVLSGETWRLGGPPPIPPTAIVTSAVVDAANFRVTLRYASNRLISLSSIDSGDVALRPAAGGSIPATLLNKTLLDSGFAASAEYSFAAPGGAWDSPDNGTYSVWVLPVQVSGGDGTFVTTQRLQTYNLWFNNPTAQVVGESVANGWTYMDVDVLYADAAGSPVGISLASVGDGDVQLSGPNNYLGAGTLLALSAPHPGQVLATYRFPAAGGYWDWSDNGSYSLRIRPGEVWDEQGYLVPSLTLRTYGLYFQTPSAVLTNTTVAAGSAAMQVSVTYRANSGNMSWASLGTGDVELAGPGGYLALGTLFTRAYNAASNSYLVTYRLAAPGGSWNASDNGTYSLRIRPQEVWDALGYPVPPLDLRSYFLWFPPGFAGTTGCTADFDGDGEAGTLADVEAFFACLAGTCCETCATADVNGDGDIGTEADIEAFFRVLAGGSC